jgi:S-adenosylmethionine synthetase
MFGTEKVSRELVIETIKKNFDLSPTGIIKTLDLKNPIYQKTATYGHFGRDDVSWEYLDKVEIFTRLIR